MGKGVPEMLKVQEVADLMRVSVRTVWRELKAGRLKGIQFGGQWRIRRGDLEAYFDERSSCPTQAVQ